MTSHLRNVLAAILLLVFSAPAYSEKVWWCESADGSFFRSSKNYPGKSCQQGELNEPPEVDTDEEPTPQEFAACRKAFTEACLPAVPCGDGSSGCVKYVCDPIPTAAKLDNGETMTSQLAYFSRGGDGGVANKDDEFKLKWFGGPGESQNGPGLLMCSYRYEAKAVLHFLKSQADAKRAPPDKESEFEPEIIEALTDAERKYALETFERLDKGGACVSLMPAIKRRFPGYKINALHTKLAVMYLDSRGKPPSQYCLSCVAKAMNTDLGLSVSQPRYAQLLSSTADFDDFLEQLGTAQCAQRQGAVTAMAPGPSATAAPSRPSEQACFEKIVAIHQRGDREMRAASGQRSAEVAAMTRTQRAQLELFSGECAHHSQASSYVSKAREQLAESGALGVQTHSTGQRAQGHHPAGEANECMRANSNDAYGGFTNTCTDAVSYIHCFVAPQQDRHDTQFFNCVRPSGKLWKTSTLVGELKPGATNRTGHPVGGRTLVVACRAPYKVQDAFFDGKELRASCVDGAGTSTSTSTSTSTGSGAGASVHHVPESGMVSTAGGRGKSKVIMGDGKSAVDCVSLLEVAKGDSRVMGNSGRVLVNRCTDTVTIFWCYVDKECARGTGASWNIGPGKSWPVSASREVRWGACHGPDTGNFEEGTAGLRIICRAPLR